jgi:hypothetical protein
MKKIEIIWRDVLEEASKNPAFEQKKLAIKYGFSTSTVFAAINPLRQMGAIEVTSRNFKVINFEKILMYWATHRNLMRDLIYSTYVDMPVMEIEGLVDNKTIYGCYSALRLRLKSAPSEYDKVYFYTLDPTALKLRFPKVKHAPNIFILKADPYLLKYGKTTPPSQTFVDLWNLKDWYADEFLKALKEKYYAP